MEFCPICILHTGLASEIDSGEPASEDTVKPTSEPRAQGFEHYELVRDDDGQPVELGRGAMGVTYRAIDIALGCPVALKVVSERYLSDESARLRFLREARAAASVRHPKVASVFHLGRTGQNYFYASPEQFSGVPVDIRSDLYSLGATLWQMLTGRAPFRGAAAEVMYQHLHAPLTMAQLGQVPQPAVLLLEVLLEKNPALRFQNPTEMLTALAAVTSAIEAREIRVILYAKDDPFCASEITGDGLLMLGDRRLPFAVEFDQPCIKPQLRRTEANKFLEELEWLLLREATQEPHEGDLVGKAKTVMRAPAPAELHEIFFGQAGGALELVAGNITGVIPRTPSYEKTVP